MDIKIDFQYFFPPTAQAVSQINGRKNGQTYGCGSTLKTLLPTKKLTMVKKNFFKILSSQVYFKKKLNNNSSNFEPFTKKRRLENQYDNQMKRQIKKNNISIKKEPILHVDPIIMQWFEEWQDFGKNGQLQKVPPPFTKGFPYNGIRLSTFCKTSDYKTICHFLEYLKRNQ